MPDMNDILSAIASIALGGADRAVSPVAEAVAKNSAEQTKNENVRNLPDEAGNQEVTGGIETKEKIRKEAVKNEAAKEKPEGEEKGADEDGDEDLALSASREPEAPVMAGINPRLAIANALRNVIMNAQPQQPQQLDTVVPQQGDMMPGMQMPAQPNGASLGQGALSPDMVNALIAARSQRPEQAYDMRRLFEE